MAVNKVTRSHPVAQPFLKKLRVYEALFRLNEGFDRVLEDLQRLKRYGFRRNYLSAFRVIVEETRAAANLEVVEELQRREEQEWGRFACLRRRWDKKFEDPNDVIILAKRRRQELKQEALRKRKSTGAPAKHTL